MNLIRLVLLIVPGLLAGCGDSSPLANTLSVTCDGSLSLAGAKSVDVSNGANGQATLSFPDPAIQNQTGTIQVKPGSRCTIGSTSKV